jgi:integrase/recombinase XerC
MTGASASFVNLQLQSAMFHACATEFKNYLKFEKRYSPHTLLAYGSDIDSFGMWLNETYEIEDVQDVTHHHVRSWLAVCKNDRRESVRTLNRRMSSISALYQYLRKTGYATTNPARKLHAQKLPERLPVHLKEREAEKMLQPSEFSDDFEGITNRLICELLYTTGMRRAELLQLKESDVEWGMKQIRIWGKGNKERLVPLSDTLLDDLRTYVHIKREQEVYNADALLNTPTGKALYATYVYRVVNKHMAPHSTLAKNSPHVLRHTFATHLLNNGANIQAIKDLLGHSSLAATQVYTHNSIAQLKEIHRQNHPRG